MFCVGRFIGEFKILKEFIIILKIFDYYYDIFLVNVFFLVFFFIFSDFCVSVFYCNYIVDKCVMIYLLIFRFGKDLLLI